MTDENTPRRVMPIKPKAIDWHRGKRRGEMTAVVECQCGALHDLSMPNNMLCYGFTCTECGETVQDEFAITALYPATRLGGVKPS
jgi:hypothetical protein